MRAEHFLLSLNHCQFLGDISPHVLSCVPPSFNTSDDGEQCHAGRTMPRRQRTRKGGILCHVHRPPFDLLPREKIENGALAAPASTKEWMDDVPRQYKHLSQEVVSTMAYAGTFSPNYVVYSYPVPSSLLAQSNRHMRHMKFLGCDSSTWKPRSPQ